MLRTNCTLVELTLNKCIIDSDGACQLASALCTIIHSTQELEVCSNPIGGDGATAFAEMMLRNETLKVLRLCDDSIGGGGRLILSHTTQQ